MKALTSIGLAAGLAISLSTAANAVPVLVGTTTDPTGINDLVVDGTTYDVTFSTTTLNSFSGGSLSLDADAAPVAALNALSVTELGGTIPSGISILDVDNSLSSFEGPSCFNNGLPCIVGSWAASSDSGFPNLGSSGAGFWYVQAADFAVAPTTGVPEPSTLALFGAGIIGLGASRRRRKAKA